MHPPRPLRARTGLVAVLALAVAPALPRADADRPCLDCHGEPQDPLVLASGEALPLTVDVRALRASVHGADVGCLDCHAGKDAVPHATRPASRREVVRAATEGCAGCHDGPATAYGASVHGRARARGDADAPACSDCHGAHGVERAAQAAATGDACTACHADAKRMARHGISTQVVSTYRDDFHGMTAALQRRHGLAPGARRAASCIDCHGAHDVAARGDPASRLAAGNRARTCGACHPGASARFTSAWLSHAPPSWRSATVVGGVQLFYRFMIPFMVLGLLLQIALHVYRMVVRR